MSKVQVKKVAFPDFPPDELPGGPPDKFTGALLCEELGDFYFGGFFIGPESDHWECLSVTDSLTDSLTPV